MIWFFTPYAFDKKLFDAWDKYMALVQDPNDWVCMMDGDIAFFRNDFGHHIQKYVDKYPEVSIFSCYASRSGTEWMMPVANQFNSTDILVHRRMAENQFNNHNLELTDVNNRVTGHLMVMKKQTWIDIREQAMEATSAKTILGVDTAICRVVLSRNGKIGLMRGLYVFHYYRHMEGRSYRNHLL